MNLGNPPPYAPWRDQRTADFALLVKNALKEATYDGWSAALLSQAPDLDEDVEVPEPDPGTINKIVSAAIRTYEEESSS